jgi:IS1 family transposase
MTSVHRDTIRRLGVCVGEDCERFHRARVRNVIPSTLQLDEIWTYVARKQGHLTEGEPEDWGDQYTFVAIDAATKLVISFLTGKRTGETTDLFFADLRERVLGRPQIVSDGFTPYIEGIERAFGVRVDYCQVIKKFSDDSLDEAQRRYSPGHFVGVVKRRITGTPDLDAAHTCYVERQNLTIRMGMRRFTRLTNAFSKKATNLCSAVALHFAHYNWCRVHETLRVTPAMASGPTDHVWSVDQLLDEVERSASTPPMSPPGAAVPVNGSLRAPPALRLVQGGAR